MRRRKGYLLMATLFLLMTVALLAGTLVPVVLNEVNSEKGMAMAHRFNDLERAINAYYWDTGELPDPEDEDGLRDLFIQPPGLQGWRGPYSAYPANAVLKDAWGNELIYRHGIHNQIPVVLLVSLGPNRELDTDISDFPSDLNIQPAGDDIVHLFELDRTSLLMRAKTQNVLRLGKAMLYNTFNTPPANWSNPNLRDAWNRVIRYRRCNARRAVLYSTGHNRVDDSNGGALICTSGRSGGDDIFEWAYW